MGKTINDLANLEFAEFTGDDYVLYWDAGTGQTRKCPVAHFASNADLVASAKYYEYYQGSFGDANAMPASGAADEWLIRTDTDTMWVWDLELAEWAETGSSAPAAADAPDVPYVYSYGDDNGTQTGYGWMNATNFQNTAGGALQADSGSFRPVDATVKFATLKSVGDKVAISNINITNFGTYYYRHAFFYHQGGITPTWSNATYNDIGSGFSYYVDGTADDTEVFGHNCWVNPYFGTSSYASGMSPIINNYAPADKSDVSIEWEIVDIGNAGQVDARLQMTVDGDIVSRSTRTLTGGFATNGLDLYILSKHLQLWPQPSGDAPNDPAPPASAGWPGPSLGTDFDGIDNRIQLPDFGADAADWRCNDDAAFSVSCQMYTASGAINHSIFTSPKLSFGVYALSSYYAYSWLYSDVTGIGVAGSAVMYVPMTDAPIGNTRQSWTQTFTGATSGDAQSIRTGSTDSHYFGVNGTIDGTTREFTQDPAGPRCYMSQDYYYSGGFWVLSQNSAGLWYRSLFSSMHNFLNGNPANYHQTIIGQTSSTNNGVAVPTGYLTCSGWSLWLDGKWVNTRANINGTPFADFSGDQFIGCRFLNDGSLDYTRGDEMTDWSLTSALSGSQIQSLHATHNVSSTMDWQALEAAAGRTVAVRAYYPLAEALSSGTAGDVEDFSGNGSHATSEGF